MRHHIKIYVSGILLIFFSYSISGATGHNRLTVLSAIDLSTLKTTAQNRNAGILVTDDKGRVLFSLNLDTPKVPASIFKILTALAALEQMGTDFRFPTQMAYNPTSHTLYVRGFGDPLFVSEVIETMCRQVMEKTGIQRIDRIILDHSWFDDKIQIPGTGRSLNPYDATTGALCANFNSIHFMRDEVSGAWISAEPQTPLLSIFYSDIQRTGLSRGRILIRKTWRPIYPGLLMARFFSDLGMEVSGPVEAGSFPESETDLKWPEKFPQGILTLTSPWTLEDVMKKLLQYSNNFIANQVMLALGAHVYGPPATLEKGIAVLKKTAEDLPGWETAKIAEGSGISRENRISPAQMGQLLLAFMPHHELLRRTDTQYYKTGTLTGIRTRAGYFIGTDGRLYPFAIMN